MVRRVRPCSRCTSCPDGAGGGGAAGALRAAVEREVAADEVDGRVVVEPFDGVGTFVDDGSGPRICRFFRYCTVI